MKIHMCKLLDTLCINCCELYCFSSHSKQLKKPHIDLYINAQYTGTHNAVKCKQKIKQ